MKSYTNLKVILMSTEITGTNYNSVKAKYAKILVTTEDIELQEKLTTFISLIDIMPPYRGKKYGFSQYRESRPFGVYEITTIYEWYTVYQVYETELKRYVDYRLAQEKPAWMVMAEKHGWTPPN